MTTTGTLRGESELTEAEIVAEAKANHIWLNAISLIRPSDELYRDIGKQVVDMLNASDIQGDFLDVRIGKVLYMRVNKS